MQSKCLLKPNDIQPSDPQLKVIGVFNPGAVRTKEGIVLLARVAEGAVSSAAGHVYSPIAKSENGRYVVQIDPFPVIAHSDPRKVDVAKGLQRLTYLSRLIVVRLDNNGYAVDRLETPSDLLPQNDYESYGLEDARITYIEGRYYITYVSVSPLGGICTSLLSTRDFHHFERHGMIFDLETKDVVLFPERINGSYVAYIRPISETRLHPKMMMIARSPDLVHWGEYQTVAACRPDGWDSYRIGAGCPPLLTKQGWLTIYHGVKREIGDEVGTYRVGAILTEYKHPEKVIARTKDPLLEPTEEYEKEGFVGPVIFPTGLVSDLLNPDRVILYYGGSDRVVAAVTLSLPDILNSLE